MAISAILFVIPVVLLVLFFALLGVALALFGGVFGLFRLVGWKFYSNGVVGFPQHAVDASDDVVDESVVF
jgi:hypothetical protein